MSVDQGIRDWIASLGPWLKPRVVPPGGTTGQVLTKLSNTDFDDGWQTPAAGGGTPELAMPRVLVSGRWVNPAVTATSMTTQAATVNRLYLVPFVTHRDRSIDQLGCNVSTAATGSVRLGIYASDATTGLPTGLPLVDAGTVSTGTTGQKTLAAVATLPSGKQYWTALDCSAAATFTAGAANEMWPVGGGATASNAGANHAYLTHTATTALPDLTAMTSASYTWATASVPMCAMRIA